MGFLSWLSSVFGTKSAPESETQVISWEHDHPEREAWSIITYNAAFSCVYVFGSATDIQIIRPDWDSLSPLQRVRVIVQLVSSISFYESSWDPACACVDVDNTESLGLMQISVEDQKNYDLQLGFSREDLLTVGPNIKLALAILSQQVMQQKRLILTHGEDNCYWSTFSYGYEDEKIDKIIAMAQALNFN